MDTADKPDALTAADSGMTAVGASAADTPVVAVTDKAEEKLEMSGVDAAGRPWRRVILEKPLDRHGTKYTSVVVKKPHGSDCTGTSLTALNQADVIGLSLVLPRVTEPILSKHEVLAMGIDDLGEFAGTVIGFLMTKAAKAEFGLTE